MRKFLENIYEAEKIINKLNHMAYVTYPIVKDKKLLLKILVETKIAIARLINSILQYEFLFKRIRIYKDPKENMKTFINKCAPKYNISQNQVNLIIELFDIVDMHKNSTFEFRKDEKLVILNGNSSPKVIVFEDIKEFLGIARQILEDLKKEISNSRVGKV